jgi:hypothetical protein
MTVMNSSRKFAGAFSCDNAQAGAVQLQQPLLTGDAACMENGRT